MKLNFIAVGKIKDKNISSMCGEFLSRIKKYLPAEMIEVRESRDISSKDLRKHISMEGSELIRKIPEGFTFILHETGRKFTTVEFAGKLGEKMNSSFKNLNFAIGGPFGLSDEVKKRGNMVLSLSDMTFPHEMARLILLEQTYRALTLIKGHKYHY